MDIILYMYWGINFGQNNGGSYHHRSNFGGLHHLYSPPHHHYRLPHHHNKPPLFHYNPPHHHYIKNYIFYSNFEKLDLLLILLDFKG